MMDGEKMCSETKIAMVFLVMLVVFVLPVSVSATEVVIGNASTYSNGIKGVPIMINEVTNVGVVDLNLNYDPSVVIAIGITDGDFDTTIPNLEKNSTGFVKIGALQTGSSGLNGNVTIANITFKAVGDPGSTSPLNISINELKDATPQGNDIPYTIPNGTFTVTPSSKPIPTATSTPSKGGGGDGPFLFTPSPTLTPTSTPIPTETPTLTPTFTPSASATPTQTPTSTTLPPTTNEQKQILMLVIGLMACSIMGIIIYVALKLRKK